MGFISNQWLNRGEGLRNRKYCPVAVSNTASIPDDDWSKRNRIVVEIRASKPNRQYQTVHLDAAEAEKFAVPIVNACSPETRHKIVRGLLRKLSDSDLLAVLASDLSKRVRIAPRKDQTA